MSFLVSIEAKRSLESPSLSEASSNEGDFDSSIDEGESSALTVALLSSAIVLEL